MTIIDPPIQKTSMVEAELTAALDRIARMDAASRPDIQLGGLASLVAARPPRG